MLTKFIKLIFGPRGNGQCPCCKKEFEIGEDDNYLCRQCDISIPRK